MVRVLFFAKLREITQESSFHIDAININEIKAKLCASFPILKNELPKCMYAVNQNYTNDYNLALQNNDTVAIIPPVSGG